MKNIELLKALMGEQPYEALAKALDKIPTKSVVDLQELHASLKVVPKALISWLIKELKPLKAHENVEIQLPFQDNCYMLINKQMNDVYNGHIRDGGKIIHEFKLTALPQLAAHIMSTFELYDEEQVNDDTNYQPKDDVPKAEAPKEYSQENSAVQDERIDALEQRLNDTQMQMLNDKVDDLMRVVANSKEQSKPELTIKTDELDKAGLMPAMPTPPKAGSSGNVAVPKTGIMGNKTPATDANLKPSKMKLPNLKTPAMAGPAAPKTASPKPSASPFIKSLKMSLNKSQNSTCPDCGECEIKSGTPVRCACFKALSEPVIKNEGAAISLSFKEDWDTDSIEMLYKSLMSRANGRK